MPDVQTVKKTIKQLRDVPANTTGAGQDVLLLISDYLVEVSPKEGPVHWFCRKADQLTIDCATFLLRLHAYDSSSIQMWRNLLTRCLRGCRDCVRGLGEAKITSKHTCAHWESHFVQDLTFS
jgi:senataxin